MRLQTTHWAPLLCALACVACEPSASEDASAIDAGAEIETDAGEAEPNASGELRVLVTEYRRSGEVALSGATVLVEQGGKVVTSGPSDPEGMFTAKVDWEQGPVTLTAWDRGLTTLSYVGITSEATGSDIPMRLSALTPSETVRITGRVTPLEGPQYIDVWTDSAARVSDLNTEWNIFAERGSPLEIAYQSIVVTEPSPSEYGDGRGYAAFTYAPGNWWRISVDDPSSDLGFDEAQPSKEMREIVPREHRITVPPSAAPDESFLLARTLMHTPHGLLTIGRTVSAVYDGSDFTLTLSTTDEVEASDAFTVMNLSWRDRQPSGTQIRIDSAGSDLRLSSLDWMDPPRVMQGDAEHIVWSGGAQAATSITLSPVDGTAAQWLIYVPAGVSELAWPQLPPEAQSELSGEVIGSLNCCEQRADGQCARNATSMNFSVQLGD